MKKTILARCPNCGKGLVVFEKKYFCARCKFKLWKDNLFLNKYGVALTEDIVITMCRHGRCRLDKLIAPRRKKTFSATLVWKDKAKGLFAFDFSRAPESAPATPPA